MPLVPGAGILAKHLGWVRADLLGPGRLGGGLVAVVTGFLGSGPTLVLGLSLLDFETLNFLLAFVLFPALVLGPPEFLPYLRKIISNVVSGIAHIGLPLTSNMFKLALSLFN